MDALTNLASPALIGGEGQGVRLSASMVLYELHGAQRSRRDHAEMDYITGRTHPPATNAASAVAANLTPRSPTRQRFTVGPKCDFSRKYIAGDDLKKITRNVRV